MAWRQSSVSCEESAVSCSVTRGAISEAQNEMGWGRQWPFRVGIEALAEGVYGYWVTDLWTLSYWETAGFPSDPRKLNLFCRGVDSNKRWGSNFRLRNLAQQHLPGGRARMRRVHVPMHGDHVLNGLLATGFGRPM